MTESKYVDKELFDLIDKYHVKIDKDRIFLMESKTVNAANFITKISFTTGLRKLLNTKELFAVLLHEKFHFKPDALEWTIIGVLAFAAFPLGMFFTKNIISFLFLLVAFRTIGSYFCSVCLKESEINADRNVVRVLGKNKTWLINSIIKTEGTVSFSKTWLLYFNLLFWPFKTRPSDNERIAIIKSYNL